MNPIGLWFLAAVAAILLKDVEATPYMIFRSNANFNPSSGLSGARQLCNNTATGRLLDPTFVLPLISSSPVLTMSWPANKDVIGPTGIKITNAANFKSGAAALDNGFIDAEVCEFDNHFTGLNPNFVVATTNCSGWTSTSGSAQSGVCSLNTNGLWLATSASSCSSTLPILCVYFGPTASPTKSPSRTPSKAPTLSSRPSASPTSSSPTFSPSSSPTASPITSLPSKSPSRSSKAPTTPLPTLAPGDVAGSNNDNSIGLPVGVGAGGAALFLAVVVLILLTRSRRKRRNEQTSALASNASTGNRGK